MSARVTLICDAPGCRRRVPTRQPKVLEARRVLEREGWRVAVSGWRVDPPRDGRLRLDFCPEHADAAGGR